MSVPTDLEQLFLELINEARIDPMRSAARYITSYTPLTSSDERVQDAIDYFEVDGAQLLAAYQALAAVAPLAWNEALSDAAGKHTAALIAADAQSHQLPGELSLGARIFAEGYVYNAAAENVFSYAESALHGHAGFMIDWGDGPGGMQSPAGHRKAIMSVAYSEIGIAATVETDPQTTVGPIVVTQDFADRGLTFALGVAYRDSDGNDFYSPGEGRGDLVVRWGDTFTTSAASGGYALAVAQGIQTLTLSGGGLQDLASVTTTIGGDNIKLDLVDGDTLLTSGSVEVSGPIAVIRGIGTLSGGLTLAAGNGSQTFYGTSGNDTLRGGADSDTAAYAGFRSQYAVTAGPDGHIIVTGPDSGTDTLDSIEILRFADGAFLWNADTGTLTAPAPQNALRLFAASGFAGEVGGGGTVFGTEGFQDITVASGSGAINFDPSFNRGGDIIRFSGNAADYTVSRGGSSLALSIGGDLTTIPVGTAGTHLVFADGARTLFYDSASETMRLGTQAVGGTPAPLAAPAELGALPADADLAAGARAFLTTDAHTGIGGKVELFGTTGHETVSYLGGDLNLDPSFNRGGDRLVLPGSIDAYDAYRIGSSAALISAAGTIVIPVGTSGMMLDFAGEEQLLHYDPVTQTIKIGDLSLSGEPSPLSDTVEAPASTPYPLSDNFAAFG